jgi:hypothetical protein
MYEIRADGGNGFPRHLRRKPDPDRTVAGSQRGASQFEAPYVPLGQNPNRMPSSILRGFSTPVGFRKKSDVMTPL